MYDYEYVDSFFQNYFATRVLMPEVVCDELAKKAEGRWHTTYKQ